MISQNFKKKTWFIVFQMTLWDEPRISSILQMNAFSKQRSLCRNRREILYTVMFSSEIFCERGNNHKYLFQWIMLENILRQ